ncbi:Na+-dependent transporter [Corynebacterium atypicum]|uniref:Na+-dependent transporter n=1 Tax=Corynebacterium atypicum TaxID=191610 RepID=A0ABM5QNX5_9CORY|nr:bile acid:sodium symporter family protein [Corynebacterium atypicum]AIG64529.1 Na+-dependent transporter [Corynebacterium atypicum]
MTQTNVDPRETGDGSARLVVLGFPLFILAGTIIAFLFPAPFVPLTNYITIFLMVIMFSMGLTITIPDFKVIARKPAPVFIGVVAQFVIMPALAFLVAHVMKLDPAVAVGLYMLGSVPGGTSSNVIAYLAKGDVAVSIAMTSVSTLVSPIMTPILMLLLAGTRTDVNASAMALSLVQTVLVPVIAGLLLRTYANAFVDKILPVLPVVSIVGIGGVVFGTVAKSADLLASVGVALFVAVFAHNVLGYLLGYLTGKVFRLPEPINRTLATEIGTQSAGLASGMSAKFFAPEAALPGAVAAVLHNITGAIYAALMRRRPLPAAAAKQPVRV